MKLMKGLVNFWKEEDGVTALEYGLIAALIAVFIIGAVTLAGGSVSNVFNTIGNAMGGLGT